MRIRNDILLILLCYYFCYRYYYDITTVSITDMTLSLLLLRLCHCQSKFLCHEIKYLLFWIHDDTNATYKADKCFEFCLLVPAVTLCNDISAGFPVHCVVREEASVGSLHCAELLFSVCLTKSYSSLSFISVVMQ